MPLASVNVHVSVVVPAFVRVVPEDYPCDPDKASSWLNLHGLNVGDQWPWATDKLRLVWAKDDYANIVEAWEDLKCP